VTSTEQQVLEAVERVGRPISASAVTVLLGGVAEGVLGERPSPEVQGALTALRDGGRVASAPSCPVCGTLGEVWMPAGDAPATLAPAVGPDAAETAETLRPLIDEGEIEVGERVELVEGECCIRTARPWRPTPPPA
jgi:hypothetical protein